MAARSIVETGLSGGTLTDVAVEGDSLRLSDDDTNPVIYYHDFTDLTDWSNSNSDHTGGFTIVNYPIGHGGKVAQTTGSDSTWWHDSSANGLIPYDSNKLYEYTVRVRQTVSDSRGTGYQRIYGGVEGVASDGVTFINGNGENAPSSMFYNAVASYELLVAEGWKTFRGYFTGHSTTNPTNANDPTDPSSLETGVAYFRPMILMNYSGGNGTAQIDYVQVREINSLPNLALNKNVTGSHPTQAGSIAYVTDGNRATSVYYGAQNSGTNDTWVTIDLGEPKPIQNVGVWHYNSDGRTYQKTLTQVTNGEHSLYKNPTPLADYSLWTLGTNGSQGNFNHIGDVGENSIVKMLDPFQLPANVWRCLPTGVGSGPDGGWNLSWSGDNTKTYRMSVWVRKTENLADGTTYFGCDNDVNTENLDGSPNGNPYFWNGDLPELDEWFLMVGIIHPAGYTGGDTGIAGVYDRYGTKVYDGTEYRWAAGSTTQMMRAYLYYCGLSDTTQEFVYPRIELVDGSEPSIDNLRIGHIWRILFYSADSGEYAETTKGKWHGTDTIYARYIRDRLAGSTSNTGDHWLEIEAYGSPDIHTTGNRVKQLSLDSIGRISSTTIDWTAYDGIMFGNGSNGVIEYNPALELPSSTSEVTMETWVKWYGLSSVGDERGTLFTNGQSYYLQVLDDGRIGFYTYWNNGGSKAGSQYTYSDSSIVRDEWTHIAATEDSTGLRKIYINGVLDKTEQKEASIWTQYGVKIFFGEQIGTGSRDLYGAMRHARLWNVARTQTEIQNAMNVDLQGNESGLVGCWPFDEGTGNIAYDISPNGINIDLSAPRWLKATVETNVSYDGGSTWQGWKTPTKGGSIPDIAADQDGHHTVVDFRQTLTGTYTEVSPNIEDMSVTIDGNSTVAKRWTGSQWVEIPIKTWDDATEQWITTYPRAYVDDRWL